MSDLAQVYYNEIDPFAARWLRALIDAGQLPAGDVDTRSIWDVHPDDLIPYRQCHFFAGIGGWAYALQLADWPDDRPVWTGSCPCQPFSAAGAGRGFADERHLWPAFYWLISECRPPVVFGEQVDKALTWLDLVYADLEAAGYAVGAVDLPAGSVGALHRRQRLWFVADTHGQSSVGSAITRTQRHPWRVEPPVGRVAHGLPHKVVEPFLRGYGNALVPQVAEAVIRAYLETARG